MACVPLNIAIEKCKPSLTKISDFSVQSRVSGLLCILSQFSNVGKQFKLCENGLRAVQIGLEATWVTHL